MHEAESHHHRERDGDADDQGGARTAEEQDQHDEDEADSLEHGMGDFVDGRINQVRAVEVSHDLHVLSLQPLIELGDFGVDGLHHPRRILPPQQQEASLNRVVAVVHPEDAMAFLDPELQLAKIAHQDGRSVPLSDDDVAHVFERLDQADASDDVAQLAPVQNAAAGIGAVGLDGIGDIFQRQTKPYELLRIELKLKLRRDAAEV